MHTLLRLEFYKGYILGVEAVVTYPLGVDLLGEKVKGGLGQTGADPVEPEVAA